jgi:hypothetical protein
MGGEKPGIAAVLILTPTPSSPVEGEGTEPRLIAACVPNRIDLPARQVQGTWREAVAKVWRTPGIWRLTPAVSQV